MSWEGDFLTGLCEHIRDAPAPEYTPPFLWSPDGLYPDQPAGIAQFLYGVPDKPDRLVSWAVVPLTAGDAKSATRLVSITANVRGTRDPRVAPSIADAIFLKLHGLQRAVWGGIPVVQVWHQSAVPMGVDGNNRAEHTSTFHAWTVHPSMHTTE